MKSRNFEHFLMGTLVRMVGGDARSVPLMAEKSLTGSDEAVVLRPVGAC
jgi:hypothetical protein